MLGRALARNRRDRHEQLLLRGAGAGHQALRLQFRAPLPSARASCRISRRSNRPSRSRSASSSSSIRRATCSSIPATTTSIIKDPSYWGASFNALKPVNTPDVAIDTQLQKIGLKPDDIKYVVPSHLHLDHGGNVGKFPNSTIVVQKDEIQNAFWPKPGTGGPYMIGDVLPLRAANTDYPNAAEDAAARGRPRPVRRRNHRGQALGRSHARQPDDDRSAEEHRPHHPDRRQRLFARERGKEHAAEYRAGLQPAAASSPPSSGSA